MTAVKEQVTALIATFPHRRDAERFVNELKSAGFKDDEIGLIAPNDEPTEVVEEGAAAGVIAGGALGTFAGAAAIALVPGLGPALGIGLLVGALGGAAAGAATGGIFGTLVGLGVAEDEAHTYEEEFLNGRSLVVVQALGRGGEALAILNRLRPPEPHDQPRTGRKLLVKEVMTPTVQMVEPDTPLQEAAEKMKALGVGPLPVIAGNRLIGVITDRDITVRGTAEGIPPKLGRVRDVMTRSVVYCFEDDDVEEATHTMKQHQIRRLIVINHDKEVVGIVSLGDIATATGDEKLAGETLERVSETF